jgi:hypothetical protein
MVFFLLFFLKLWIRLPLEKSKPMDDDLDKIKNKSHTVFFFDNSVCLEHDIKVF